MDFEFTGLEELRNRLTGMSNAKLIEEKALKKGGEYLREKLESNVYSHGLKNRSGKSAESFKISPKVINGAIEVGLSNQNSDAFYLFFHEFGTSKMPARPVVRPIFEQEKTNIEKEMAEGAREGLGL
ncbi:HK97-gp10 family putative phage morphogenesis protein [Viridibacillus sp. FSL R5-0468]|uniref:HK97-gp10 family putative phage morphogenesis protein n=1 Tax=Viridibacillus sp. FSL R5-0468 TaxID=2921640 RepID=UPI0030F71433